MINRYNVDWVVWALGIVLAVLVIGGGYAIYSSYRAGGRDREAFMAECEQHRAHYECVAMWRAGETRETVVPVVTPVIIGGGR